MTLPGTILIVLIFFLCVWLTDRDIPDFHKGRRGWNHSAPPERAAAGATPVSGRRKVWVRFFYRDGRDNGAVILDWRRFPDARYWELLAEAAMQELAELDPDKFDEWPSRSLEGETWMSVYDTLLGVLIRVKYPTLGGAPCSN